MVYTETEAEAYGGSLDELNIEMSNANVRVVSVSNGASAQQDFVDLSSLRSPFKGKLSLNCYTLSKFGGKNEEGRPKDSTAFSLLVRAIDGDLDGKHVTVGAKYGEDAEGNSLNSLSFTVISDPNEFGVQTMYEEHKAVYQKLLEFLKDGRTKVTSNPSKKGDMTINSWHVKAVDGNGVFTPIVVDAELVVNTVQNRDGTSTDKTTWVVSNPRIGWEN